MRHLKRGRRLGRNQEHRVALFRNLACALFQHKRIITTVPKAKEVRAFIEKLITLGKKGTLHARRLALSRLRHKDFVTLLFKEIAPIFANRQGGYTRILKRHERRLGDGGETAILELVMDQVEKVTPVPAPVAPEKEEAKS
ncbi:MAG: 50S ribosomal protein L17 [Gemmataceae bacterium]|nr:50S ribosomal protein L17 [Gemmataceae bacterium]